MTLEECLGEAGLAHLIPAFHVEGVRVADIAVLSNDELAALGVVRIGDRARLRAVAASASVEPSDAAPRGSGPSMTRAGSHGKSSALDGATRVARASHVLPESHVGPTLARTPLAPPDRQAPDDGALVGATRVGASDEADVRTDAVAGLPARIGSYLIRGTIGAGGMGVILRARHVEEGWARRQGGDVAVKLIHPHLASSGGFRDRFLAEAALGKRIAHPAMVSTHEVLADGDILAMVMTLVEGAPLSSCIVDGGMTLEAALRLLEPIGEALDHIHSLGIVHRDIKPANILVRANGTPVVLDLGIAKDSSSEDNRTKTATAMGTVAWMAPEQADARAVDGAADRYAFGLLAYVLLSGRMPWAPDSSEYRIAAVKFSGQLESLGRVARVTTYVEAAVMRMTSLDPDQRYRSCGAFVTALRASAHDGGARAGAPSASGVHGTNPPPSALSDPSNRRVGDTVRIVDAVTNFRSDHDSRVDVFLTPDQLNSNASASATVRRNLVCAACAGRGMADRSHLPVFVACVACAGTGQVGSGVLFWKSVTLCGTCAGTGKTVPAPPSCPTCLGSGEAWAERVVTFDVSDRMRFGVVLQLPDAGLPSRSSDTPGTVYATLKSCKAPVVPLEHFTQRHLDIYLANTRDFWTEAFAKRASRGIKRASASTVEEFAGVFARASDTAALRQALSETAILKGEAFLGFSGPHFLTNYRVSLLIDRRRYAIPLTALERYDLNEGPFTLAWHDGTRRQSLSVTGTMLTPDIVQEARSARAYVSLDPNETTLLQASRETILVTCPTLALPTVGWL